MEETSNRQRRARKKTKGKLKLGRIVLIVGVLVYFGMFVHAFFGQLLKTYIVNFGTIEYTDNAIGYIIRDEKVISNSFGDKLRPIKYDGERVKKGSVIATVFKESTEDFEKKVQEIDDKIQSSMKEQEKNNLGTVLFSDDIRKLNDDNKQKIEELCLLENSDDFSRVIELKSSIDNNLLKKAQISGRNGPASQYITRLLNEKKSYEDKINSLKQNIVSQNAGVVSYNVDGVENLLTPQSIPQLTVNQLETIEQNADNKSLSDYRSVKIVDNFECYIASILPKNKILDDVQEGKKINLRFLGSDDELVPAIVVRINKQDSGKSLVVFRINKNVENLLDKRKINIDIVWSISEGLKIPVSSIVKMNEKEGVLAVKANYTAFREVEVETRDNQFAIIKGEEANNKKSISLYDEIILNGSNVEEGRQVRKWDF